MQASLHCLGINFTSLQHRAPDRGCRGLGYHPCLPTPTSYSVSLSLTSPPSQAWCYL